MNPCYVMESVGGGRGRRDEEKSFGRRGDEELKKISLEEKEIKKRALEEEEMKKRSFLKAVRII